VQPWTFIGRVLQILEQLVPGAALRVERTSYPFCVESWDIGLEQHGTNFEVLGCGLYTPDVVALLGGDPARHTAIGLGLGLERLASLHYGIRDVRMLESARV
jgi:phenylalanyl-tRNA synthetase alpha subunit